MQRMINRALRACLLDRELFQEVQADTSLNQQALLVVVIVSLAGGLGVFLNNLIYRTFAAAVLGSLVTAALGVANYYIWAYATHFIGTNMFKGKADPGEMLRTLGFASAPRLLALLFFIPCLGPLLNMAGGIWALAAGFVGVQEALDLDTTETLVTVVLGWLVIVIISSLVSAMIGIGAFGLASVFTFLGR